MNHSMSSNNHLGFLLFIILGAIGAITPLAIDMYLPAMPSIAKDLGVSAGSVQVTLTMYTAGFAIGQLVHGPLADSFGRKPMIVGGLIFFGLGSVVCASTSSIEQLVLVRAAQGFAGAAAAVIIQAVVRDMFEREDFSRAMSFVILVMTMAPLIAPMLGGHLAIWFGWRSIFWVLTGFSLIVVCLVLWKIPETLKPENRQAFHPLSIVKNYVQLFRSVEAMSLILCGAFSFGGMFAFLTAGSFVYIDIYGVSPDAFGYLFGLNIVALIAMTSFNGRFVKRLGSRWMLRFGLLIQSFSAIGLVSGWLFGWGLWGLVPFVVTFISAMSTIGSNSMAILLNDYPKMAGTVSSLAGTLRFGTGSVVGMVVAMMPGNVVWPMVMGMAGCSLISVSCYWVFGRVVK